MFHALMDSETCDATEVPKLSKLIAMSEAELAQVDPVEMNLLVASGIPGLADLDVDQYVTIADLWADDVRARLPEAEAEFHKSPEHWKNDVRFFRLGLVCWYVDQVLGIRYREDQQELTEVLYTDASDLFLHGVMSTRRGTCGNLATLHVALGWRLGWPVSLACVGSHFICRFDDGEVTHNIEATKTGGGGFHSHPDDFYLREHRLSPTAVTCGSDLRAVTPREMLGLFFGLRGRFYDNTDQLELAEADYLVARSLFPRNRQLYLYQNQISVQCSMNRFEPGEKGHPIELASWLGDVVRLGPWHQNPSLPPLERTTNEHNIRSYCSETGRWHRT